jgi:hypothetical protein
VWIGPPWDRSSCQEVRSIVTGDEIVQVERAASRSESPFDHRALREVVEHERSTHGCAVQGSPCRQDADKTDGSGPRRSSHALPLRRKKPTNFSGLLLGEPKISIGPARDPVGVRGNREFGHVAGAIDATETRC